MNITGTLWKKYIRSMVMLQAMYQECSHSSGNIPLKMRSSYRAAIVNIYRRQPMLPDLEEYMCLTYNIIHFIRGVRRYFWMGGGG